jgi:uncharacterized phage protein gp47/JayE
MSNLNFQTLQQKEAQIIADVELQTGQEIPPIQSEWDRIWARVLAALSKVTDKGIAVAFRDALLSTTRDINVVNEWAGWTKTKRKQKTQTVLRVTGTGTPSATIGGGPGGISYSADGGQKYYFETDLTVPVSGSIDTDITAYIAGPDGNLSTGELAINGQNPDISSILTITGITDEGEDEESFDSYKQETQRAARRPVMSDNYSYYFSTAREVDDVFGAYPYVGKPGALDIYVQKTAPAIPSPGDRIAPAPLLTEVLEYFDGTADGTVRYPPDFDGFLPDAATVPRFNVYSVTETAFRVRVYSISPDTTENREDISSAIAAYFAERAPYVKGVSIRNTSTMNTDAIRAQIQNVVDANEMDSFGGVEFSLAASWLPITGNYSLGKGELATVTVEFPP